MNAPHSFNEQLGRIEGLIQRFHASSDPEVRRNATDLVASLMALNGAGFSRVLDSIRESESGVQPLIQSLASDEAVGPLLVLYGLHPDHIETRVERGIEAVRATLHRSGIHVEFLGIDETAVYIRVLGDLTKELESVIRTAIQTAAPDARDIAITVGAREIAA